MNRKPNENIAKFVIPTAIAFWLAGIVVFREGVPSWVQVVAGVTMAAGIAGLVGFLLLRQSGWGELVRRFPAGGEKPRAWHTCPSAVMATVSMDSPDYVRSRVRLNFVLRAAADESALHLSTVPPFSLLLPPIRIPWSAVKSVRHFDASGWIAPASEPGMIFQLSYDPGYRGKFMEIEIAQPHCFLQLPAMAR